MTEDADTDNALAIVARSVGATIASAQSDGATLVGPDGHTIAVLVTASSAPAERAPWAPVNAMSWEAPTLGSSWTVALTLPDDDAASVMRRVRERVEPLLLRLEAEEVTTFDTSGPSGAVPASLIDALRSLRVRSGRSGTADAAARITLETTAGFSTSPEAVNSAVESAAIANAARLVAMSADVRHLFVWIDPADTAAALMLDQAWTPPPPRLPPGIDVVWVATRGDAAAGSVWHAVPPGPWAAVSSPRSDGGRGAG